MNAKNQLPHRSSRSQAGFTLLELLTAIAVVSVVATLISSALNQTRARAQRVSCINNLRQLGTAWILYADDNDDQITLNRSMPGPANEKIFGRRNTPDSWVTGNPKEDLTSANIEKGSLFHYVKSPAAYHCPADRSPVLIKKNVRRTRSYSMSAYLNGDEAGVDPRVKTRLAEVQNQPAARIFVLIEEDVASPWLGSFIVVPRDKSAFLGGFLSVPGAWHDGGANVSFADAHVEHWRWRSLRKAGQTSGPSLARHQMSDTRRLQEAVPRP